MQITSVIRQPGSQPTQFTLVGESEADIEFLDALDHQHHGLRVVSITRKPHPATRGFTNTGVTLDFDANAPELRRRDATSKAVSALSQLFGLILTEAAQHRHISATATNPQPQEQLTTGLVQLQIVGKALGEIVSQCELMLKKVQCAHVNSSSGGKSAIVAQGGAA